VFAPAPVTLLREHWLAALHKAPRISCSERPSR